MAKYTSKPNFDSNPRERGNKRIVVNNVGKTTFMKTERGERIWNSDKIYNGTTSIRYTSRGAYIVTDNFESQT